MEDLSTWRQQLERVLVGMRFCGFNFHTAVILELERTRHEDDHYPGAVCFELVGGWWVDEKRSIKVVSGCPDSILDPVRVGKLTQLVGGDITAIDLDQDGTLVVYTNCNLVITAWANSHIETSWHFHVPNWRDNVETSFSVHCDDTGHISRDF